MPEFWKQIFFLFVPFVPPHSPFGDSILFAFFILHMLTSVFSFFVFLLPFLCVLQFHNFQTPGKRGQKMHLRYACGRC